MTGEKEELPRRDALARSWVESLQKDKAVNGEIASLIGLVSIDLEDEANAWAVEQGWQQASPFAVAELQFSVAAKDRFLQLLRELIEDGSSIAISLLNEFELQARGSGCPEDERVSTLTGLMELVGVVVRSDLKEVIEPSTFGKGVSGRRSK